MTSQMDVCIQHLATIIQVDGRFFTISNILPTSKHAHFVSRHSYVEDIDFPGKKLMYSNQWPTTLRYVAIHGTHSDGCVLAY